MLRSITLLAGALALTISASAQSYHLVDLGTFGGTVSAANGLNSKGYVVGAANTVSNSTSDAFLFDGASMINLGTLGGSVSMAMAVNVDGLVVGNAETPNNVNHHAFLYDGTMHDLGTLGGSNSFANDINGAAQVVGAAYTGSGGSHAFYYDGIMHDLGTLGGSSSTANAINSSGQVVGSAFLGGDVMEHAFIWHGSSMQDLGTLGGPSSIAYGINDKGQIVGWSYTSNTIGGHAFLMSGGSMIDLGTLGGQSSFAYSVNSSGVVVGNAETSSPRVYHGFLFAGSAMQDINSLLDARSAGWTVTDALRINDFGWIAGSATNSAGQPHAVLLVPDAAQVVDPTAFSLFRGNLAGGSLASLFDADHNYLQVRPGLVLNSSEAPIQIILNGRSPLATVSSLAFQCVSHANTPSIGQTLELFDWSANTYVVIDSRTVSTSDGTVNVTAPNASRFIQAGTNALRARISYRPTGPVLTSGWSVFVDQSVWTFMP